MINLHNHFSLAGTGVPSPGPNGLWEGSGAVIISATGGPWSKIKRSAIITCIQYNSNNRIAITLYLSGWQCRLTILTHSCCQDREPTLVCRILLGMLLCKSEVDDEWIFLMSGCRLHTYQWKAPAAEMISVNVAKPQNAVAYKTGLWKLRQ